MQSGFGGEACRSRLVVIFIARVCSRTQVRLSLPLVRSFQSGSCRRFGCGKIAPPSRGAVETAALYASGTHGTTGWGNNRGGLVRPRVPPARLVRNGTAGLVKRALRRPRLPPQLVRMLEQELQRQDAPARGEQIDAEALPLWFDRALRSRCSSCGIEYIAPHGAAAPMAGGKTGYHVPQHPGYCFGVGTMLSSTKGSVSMSHPWAP